MNETVGAPITVSVTVNAPVVEVWDKRTSPDHITQWNFASDNWECPTATNDVRVGGQFSSTMAAKDKSFSFEFGGIYTEVEDQKLLAYTMGAMQEYDLDAGRKVRVVFEDLGNNTTCVTETFDPEPIHSLEQQREGWHAILENFKKHVETV